MTLRQLAIHTTDVPIPRHLMLELLKDYKRPNDKISELIKKGELVAVKRGLYIPGKNSGLSIPEPFLIANHIWGPSYISLESALSFWDMIPERVHEISSATIKVSKKYETSVGRFSYFHLPVNYYSLGIEKVKLSTQQTVLLASKEKAICDKIIFTSGVKLRSVRQTLEFLMEDLRIDVTVLSSMNLAMIDSWVQYAPKKSSLSWLVKALNAL